MSLYGIFGEEPVKEASKLDIQPSSSAKALPTSFRLLQSQIHAKKTQLVQSQRNFVAPVVDLSSRNRNTGSTPPLPPAVLRPHKAVPIGDGPPLSFIPKSLKEDKVFLFGEVLVEDEYNPTAPTDYECHKQKLDERKAKEKIAREIAKRLHREHLEETEKRTSGAAIAPPQALMESDCLVDSDSPEPTEMPPPSFTPSFGGVGKGMGVAANIMTKFGYKEGGGLGRTGQGMSTALKVERLGKERGVIINEHELLNNAASNPFELFGVPPPVAAPVLPTSSTASEAKVNMAEALKKSTRILLLKNMVGADEIDDQLEPEVKDEMKKYGQVNKVVIYRLLHANDDEAVRIFVEFTNVAQAIKAFVDLNGRFFGGRSIRATFYDLDNYNNNHFDK